jgi:hypothetical protein
MMADPNLERKRHVRWLLLGLFVTTAALLLNVDESRSVNLFGQRGWKLPPICLSRLAFDVRCPGCGLTRSAVHLAHGRWAESFAMHRLGWLVFGLIALQIPYRAVCLAIAPRTITWPRGTEAAIVVSLAVLLFLNRAWDWLVG